MKNFKYTISGNTYEVEIIDIEGEIAKIEVNGTPYMVEIHQQVKNVKTPTLVRPLVREPQKNIEKSSSAKTFVRSPLPGIIIEVAVKSGDTIKKGQKLLVMEAMKMENEISSEYEGLITSVKVVTGQSVLQDEVLIEIG